MAYFCSSKIRYMASEIIQKLQWRYATKKFDSSRKISEEKLGILMEAFNLTATSYGLQPLKMVIVSDTEMKKNLVPMTMNQKQVEDCSQVVVLCMENEMPTEFITAYFDNVEQTRNTPREILKPFETFITTDFSKKDPEVVKRWMAKQVYLALGNLLTVCAVEEIDSCPIEGFEPSKYDDYLGLTKMGLASVVVLAIGYRAEDDMFSEMKKVRRGIENVVIKL